MPQMPQMPQMPRMPIMLEMQTTSSITKAHSITMARAQKGGAAVVPPGGLQLNPPHPAKDGWRVGLFYGAVPGGFWLCQGPCAFRRSIPKVLMKNTPGSFWPLKSLSWPPKSLSWGLKCMFSASQIVFRLLLASNFAFLWVWDRFWCPRLWNHGFLVLFFDDIWLLDEKINFAKIALPCRWNAYF